MLPPSTPSPVSVLPLPGFVTSDFFLSAFIQSPLQVSQPENHLLPLETHSFPQGKDLPYYFLPTFWNASDSTQMSTDTLFSTTGWENELQLCKLEFWHPSDPVHVSPSEDTSGWHL